MIRTVSAKVAAAPSGAAQWQPHLISGVSQSSVVRINLPQATGVAIIPAPAVLLVKETAGVALVGTYSGTVVSNQIAGVAQQSIANLGTSKQGTGGKIVQTTYSLAGTYGCTSAAISHPSGSTDWLTPNNAIGIHDSVNATISGQLLSAVDALLTLSYATLPNKASLTITNVQVVYYFTFTPSILGGASLALRHSINGGTTYTLDTTILTTSSLYTKDITAEIAGNWDNLQNFKTQLEFIAALADSTTVATCDAVELVITANATQIQ